LRQLAEEPLPLGFREAARGPSYARDLYLDTADGWLQSRGISCRFRTRSDDRRQLSIEFESTTQRGGAMFERVLADVDTLDPLAAVTGTSEPARRLRALVDPLRLLPVLNTFVERRAREATGNWLHRARFEVTYDAVTVEHAGLSRSFQELGFRRLREGRPTLAQVSAALGERPGMRPILVGRLERVRQLAATLQREAGRRAIEGGGAVALVALDAGRIACNEEDGRVTLPIAPGRGEGACRALLAQRFGSTVGDLRLIGTVPASATGRPLEVWLVRHLRQGRIADVASGSLAWLPVAEITARIGTPSLSDPESVAALTLATRSDVLRTGRPSSSRTPVTAFRADVAVADDGAAKDPERLLDGERSMLEFNARVLALAEDVRTPLLERLQFLAIVSANLDEFFMVRVSGLKRLAMEITGENSVHDTAEEQLDAVRHFVRTLIVRQERCLTACLRALAPHQIGIVPWSELTLEERTALRRHFNDVVFAALTPQAVTEAPGFPPPSAPSLVLSFGVIVKDPQTGPMHFAYLRIPPVLSRLLPVRGGRSFVLLEELVRDQLDRLYPGRDVLRAFLFRVTRGGDLDVVEQNAGNLLQAVEEDAKRRQTNAVVRLEVEQGMPATFRDALLSELRLEGGAELVSLGVDDVFEISGPLDLGGLREIAGLPVPELRFPPFQPRAPFIPDRSIFAAIRERDHLVHHPYDDFAATVQRFLDEAADDADVTTMKVTLYRAGERSPIVDALLRAAVSGKEVVAFVELKARFDEERNARWTRRLRDAGVHVVYGLVGLKNHAKVALVVRQEADALRQYVHIGTGNYHAGTARLYTDLGLFSADASLASEINDLFNELTGSSRWPRGNYRRLLVAPHQLLPALVARIDREAEHARAGRGGRIRLKINGLSDVELISALYRASQAGVTVDLIVRGICRLRPGVPGLSEHIRVFSILGRFLEHARIYYFANGGDPEYFIGSADWRARNVRRRVEVVAPIADASCRARLDSILERELADASAWQLQPDGDYTRAAEAVSSSSVSQTTFATEAQMPIMTAPA
jgi:polyphosphate kinase